VETTPPSTPGRSVRVTDGFAVATGPSFDRCSTRVTRVEWSGFRVDVDVDVGAPFGAGRRLIGSHI